MFKLTPGERKLLILLGLLLLLGLILRFTFSEPLDVDLVSGSKNPGGKNDVGFYSNSLKSWEQENNAVGKTVEEKLIIVHVVGEVVSPGIYTLEEGSRVYEALEKAGGYLESAAIDKINLAQPLLDGQQVKIPSILEQDSGTASQDGTAQSESFLTVGNKVNINTATVSELKALPGIGEVKAQSIINYRRQNGLFRSIEELLHVSGIGAKTLEGIKEFITIY